MRIFAAAARAAVGWSEALAAGRAAGPVRTARHAVFEMPLTVVRDLRPVVSQRMTLPLSFLDRRH